MRIVRMSRFITAMMLALASAALPAHAQTNGATSQAETAQSPIAMRADQVVALINGELEVPLEDVFTPAFLAAVPPSQLQGLSSQLTSQFGKAVAVERLEPSTGSRSALEVRMERAIAKGGIAIDPAQDNRISELLFRSFEPTNDSVEKITADLNALPGTVSAYYGPLDGSDPILSVNPDVQMPIGSTFKLYVLAAVGKLVADGHWGWQMVGSINQKSFPSGQMQDWPESSPATFHTLASMMISISDNTATDTLMSYLADEKGPGGMLGTLREAGHSQPYLNEPFLTTRELFLLKGGPQDRLARYADGTGIIRSQILDTIEQTPVNMTDIQSAFAAGPVALDVEWFANTGDLMRLLRFMRETSNPDVFEMMAINKSMSPDQQKDWSYVGYKGGSEPGVLNLTWLLTDKQGKDHMLTLSWRNDEAALDNDAMELIAQRILALPR